ncbi:MAG: hypothetical protein ACWGMZ_05615 [Thermoguttaceae bacterium]
MQKHKHRAVKSTKKSVKKSAKVKKPIAAKKLASSHGEKKSKKKHIVVDRRVAQADRRSGVERRQKTMAVAVERRVCERRVKVNRRRQIDPTTCERDYSHDEVEFMNALEEYKRANGRMFPTCSEVLEVVRKLGYEKRPAPVISFPEEPTLVPDISVPLATI